MALAATRTAFTLQGSADSLIPQIGRLDLVGCAWNHLIRWQDAFLDEAANNVAGDAKVLGGFSHREPLASLLRRPVGADAVGYSQGTDAAGSP